MSTANRRFALHYAEMVLAMLAGMVVLGLPAAAALGAMGTSTAELERDAPALALLGMATTMTVPMVGWMRVRRHGWMPCAEMSASMLLPTFAAIGLLAGGVVGDTGTLMGVQHVAMFPAMLAAMLLRREEYSRSHADRRHEHQVAT